MAGTPGEWIIVTSLVDVVAIFRKPDHGKS
jgi:hypothetical protein